MHHISLRKDVAGITVTLICGSQDMMVWLPWFYSHLSSDCELRMAQTARILSSSVFQVVHRPGAVPTGPSSSRSLSGGVCNKDQLCTTSLMKWWNHEVSLMKSSALQLMKWWNDEMMKSQLMNSSALQLMKWWNDETSLMKFSSAPFGELIANPAWGLVP